MRVKCAFFCILAIKLIKDDFRPKFLGKGTSITYVKILNTEGKKILYYNTVMQFNLYRAKCMDNT